MEAKWNQGCKKKKKEAFLTLHLPFHFSMHHVYLFKSSFLFWHVSNVGCLHVFLRLSFKCSQKCCTMPFTAFRLRPKKYRGTENDHNKMSLSFTAWELKATQVSLSLSSSPVWTSAFRTTSAAWEEEGWWAVPRWRPPLPRVTCRWSTGWLPAWPVWGRKRGRSPAPSRYCPETGTPSRSACGTETNRTRWVSGINKYK